MDKTKLFYSLFAFILLISLVQPVLADWNWDNIKTDIPTTKDTPLAIGDKVLNYTDLWTIYKPIRVTNALGMGEVLFEGAITTHTKTCSKDCKSIMTIELTNKETLVEAIRFNKLIDGRWVETPFEGYTIYMSDKDETYEEVIWEDECWDAEYENKTKYKECDKIKKKSEILTRPVWTKMNLKDEVPAGTYQIKIEADFEKSLWGKPNEVWDWQIYTAGEWLTSWANWTVDLTDLLFYYKLDESSGTVIDANNGVMNATNTGATYGVTGKINTAYKFLQSDATDFVNTTGKLGVTGANDFSVNAWVYSLYQAPTQYGTIFSMGVNSGDDIFGLMFDNTLNAMRLSSYGGCLDGSYPSGVTLLNTWHMVTAVYNTTALLLYIDGVNILNKTCALTLSNSNGYIGKLVTDPYWLNATVDEIGLWNRTLTTDEIANLYSGGTPPEFNTTVEASITSTLNAPANGNVTKHKEVLFNCSSSTGGGATISNISLWSNSTGSWHINETVALSGTTNTTTFSKIMNEGATWLWNCRACSTTGICVYGTNNRTVQFFIPQPTITLNSPINNYYSNNTTQVFNCSATADSVVSGISNISLWTNATGVWHLNETKYGTETKTFHTTSNYTGDWTSGEYTTDKITTTYGRVELGFPSYSKIGLTYLNYTASYPNNYTVMIGASGQNVRFNIFCFNYTDSSFVQIHSRTTAAGVTQNNDTIEIPFSCFNNNLVQIRVNASSSSIAEAHFYEGWINGVGAIFTKILPQNSTLWSCSACDTGGRCNTTAPNRTVIIDSLAPVLFLTGGNGTNNYGQFGINHTLNFTATDTNLSKCWYTHGNATQYLFTCADNHFHINITRISDNVTLYANDTLGNTASQYIDWDFKLFLTNESYITNTTEGSTDNFLLNTTLKTGISITQANIIYNGTSYPGDVYSSGNSFIIDIDLIIPLVTAVTNYSFYWSITLSDSSIVNTSSHSQTVNNLVIDNCSTYTNMIYRFTIYDEETQTNLTGNTTLDIAIQIYPSDRSYTILNYSNNFTAINPVSICLGSTLLNSSFYSVDVIIRYEKNDSHVIEYYNIINDTMKNLSSLQEIALYDLAAADSTEFRLTFIGSNFLPAENVLVYVMRQYIPENTFKVVELPKTDSNGQALIHLVRNDVIYNFVILNGTSKEVLGTFNNIIAFCEDYTIGKCEINLNAYTTGTEVYNYNQENEIIISNIDYDNATREISFDFVTVSGTPKNISMKVLKTDILGNNRTMCESSVYSSGGSLSCTIPSNVENTSVMTSIYSNGKLVAYSQVSLEKSNFGEVGYLILFVMLISLVLILASTKEGVLIGLLLGVLAGMGLGLMSGTFIGIGSAGVWIIVILLIAIWKIHKGRVS